MIAWGEKELPQLRAEMAAVCWWGPGAPFGVAGGVFVGRVATVASVPPLQAATANASSSEARVVKGRVGAVRRVSSRPSWLGKVIHTIIPRRQVSRLLVGV